MTEIWGSHSDAAFSQHYCAPEGVPKEQCRHYPSRQRSGPTGRKRFLLLVDSCGRCGRILRSHQDLTWSQYDWVRRWNKGARP